MDECSFCASRCTGPFQHILTITKENLEELILVLNELKSPSLQSGCQGYQTCSKCRRLLTSSHKVAESCFQIVPRMEAANAKADEEVDFDCFRRKNDEDELDTIDLELLPLEPKTELLVEDEGNADQFLFNGLDDRLTVEYQSGCSPKDLNTKLKAKVQHIQQITDIDEEGPIYGYKKKNNRSFPIRHLCPFCKKGFADKSLMKTHIRWHTGEKPYKCATCGKAFCENSKLTVHIRTHTGERPHVCPYCAKRFSQSATLKKHIRTHTNEKPYVCEICNSRFTQSFNLTQHLRNQHNQITIYRGREVGFLTEYKCEFCPKVYRSIKSYQLHLKLHKAGKMFHCQWCGILYKSRHKCEEAGFSGVEDSMKYPCHFCGQEFKHQPSMVYHMAIRHNYCELDSGNDINTVEKSGESSIQEKMMEEILGD